MTAKDGFKLALFLHTLREKERLSRGRYSREPEGSDKKGFFRGSFLAYMDSADRLEGLLNRLIDLSDKEPGVQEKE